jgi:purine-binding chemotaxis protein CheW
LTETAYTDRTVVVVLEDADTATGLVVDGVSEVAEISPDHIDTNKPSANGARASLVRGMAKRNERVTFILDIPVLVSVAHDRDPSHAADSAALTLERTH